MKKLSIKNKLTLWYSIIIFLVSTILFVSFYLLTNRYLIYETDRSLTIHSSQIAYSIGLETNNLHDKHTKEMLDMSQKEAPGMFVEIVDSNGNNVDGNKSEFYSLALNALNSISPKFVQTKVNDFSMRVIAYPIVNNSKTIGAVIMGHQIDIYEKTLAQLRTVGLSLLVFLIAPAILIGYWLAKSATDPIKKLGVDINKINAENLARHVDVKIDTEESQILVNNFNSMLDRLENAFKLERQFLGEMAHEVKTPLAVIKSNAEVTLANERSQKEYKESIQQTLNQIDKLTNSLLGLMDFAWSQSTEAKTKFEKINISQLMEEVVNVTEYAATPKNISVSSNITPELFVKGKEDKLYQAIYNIADNAIKFTPNKGKVSIMLFKQDGKAIIEIADSGIGIDKEQQKNIFNRFYRTDQNKNIAGHGLGLAIAESIIKAHDGHIKVTSEPGNGSTFRIILNLVS